MSSEGPRAFAVKDALRAAIVQPLSFAVALHLFDSPGMALFAAFGPMALMVFVQFGGTQRRRLVAYAGLTLGGAGLIALGTLCSHSTVLATSTSAITSAMTSRSLHLMAHSCAVSAVMAQIWDNSKT